MHTDYLSNLCVPLLSLRIKDLGYPREDTQERTNPRAVAHTEASMASSVRPHPSSLHLYLPVSALQWIQTCWSSKEEILVGFKSLLWIGKLIAENVQRGKEKKQISSSRHGSNMSFFSSSVRLHPRYPKTHVLRYKNRCFLDILERGGGILTKR